MFGLKRNVELARDRGLRGVDELGPRHFAINEGNEHEHERLVYMMQEGPG
jgi:hypothetical protein